MIHKNDLQCFLYLQEITFLAPVGPIKGVLLNIISYGLGNCFWQSNYSWVVASRNTPVKDLIRSRLQSEAGVTDQRSSHFKLLIAVNF